MKKLTAVEWLQEGLELIMSHELQMQAIGLFEQAKEMEKEQIIESWDNGWHEHMNPPDTCITSVQYYNETFKSE